MRLMKRFLILIALLTSFTVQPIMVRAQDNIAPPPPMVLPIDCEIGWNCWIGNYVDHDASRKSSDYACGDQSYNTHKGTDFIIRNYRDMQAGVVVKSASDGIVIGTRDTMKDVDYRTLPKEVLAKKTCGNGVRIDHGNGWITQYCHMRKNSVRVKKGDRVSAGDIIGLVGHSGLAALPHLHFQVEYIQPGSGKRQGHVIDPFVGTSRNDACDVGENPLWPKQVIFDLPYRPLDIIDTGFSTTEPKHGGLIKGLYDDETLSVRAPKLFLWARFLHVKKGDEITYIITDPDGEEILNYASTIKKDQAYRTLHAGLRRPALNWDEGLYKGEIKVVRQGAGEGQIFRAETNISLR
jgi:murein DD-endopeptidase